MQELGWQRQEFIINNLLIGTILALLKHNEIKDLDFQQLNWLN